MSHNIFRNSITGQYEVMTRGAAWHGLGTVVKEAKTWKEAMRLAGLDWEMVKMQLEFHGEPVPAYGIFRKDYLDHDPTKAFIAPTTATYEMLQNEYVFTFLDTLMESEDAHYECAGALNGGQQVFALVNLREAFEVVPDDHHETYLCFVEDRTRRSRAKVFMTNVRTVCANTVEMALRGADDKASVGFRHTANLSQQLQDAAEAFTGARMNAAKLKEKLQALAKKQVTGSALRQIVTEIFKADEDGSFTAAQDSKMADVVRLFEHNDGDTFPEIRGTGYSLFNAITEYIDHFVPVRRRLLSAGTTDYLRAQKAMFGTGADFKAEALKVILETLRNAPEKQPVKVRRSTVVR